MDMNGGAVIRSQSYAHSIEFILCKIFDCERFGFGGIIDSDYIRRQPFSAFYIGLAYQYSTSSSQKKAQIERFINDHRFYEKMSIDYLLSFDTNKKIDGTHTVEIPFNNGEEALKCIIDSYRAVTK